MTESVAAIEVRNVSQLYEVSSGFFSSRELRALNDVSLRVPKGAVLGIVGESGCGKSTLGRVLLGLLKPSSGDVLVDGQPLSSFSRLSLAALMQPVFQDPYSSLNPSKRIRDIVGLPLSVHKRPRSDEGGPVVEQLIRTVGLGPHHLDAYPSQLSGGQRQRVAIARALVVQPEILICDEPTSALDVSVQSQILNLLMELQARLKLTYVLISHNLAVVEHMATHLAIMYLGRVIETGDAASIFESPKHPYTQALVAAALPPIPSEELPSALPGSFPNALDPPSGCAFHPRCKHAMPRCRSEQPSLEQHEQTAVACFLYSEAAS
ncbi:ABC transporter ATP-binding protein [Bradyrhizobium sp.]|uniref:ABC transporter ATP-binding protein n=1 Tax=Bradyrhizobium sp. TaxID=376 RepID=UPI0039E414A7